MGDADVLERILDQAEDARDLSFALLKDITNDFSEERKIGQGGFGEVFKGVLGDRIVAVKRIHMNIYTFDDKLFHREVTSLMKNNHRNVIRFLGVCSQGYQKPIKEDGSGKLIWANVLERLLCFEYISNGSLDKHITDELRGLEWEARYEIITGICKGLHYLHKERQIIHMDLKPENILLDHQDGKYMVPKITDFGLSRPNKNSRTVGLCFGTLEYLAPEYREESKTTSACDIYSLGLIIIELVTGCKDIPDETNVLRRWRHRWKRPPTQLQYQQVTRCIYIAKRCREKTPEHRPSILKIISFLTESESTYGQISHRFNEDDMLGIKPLQLWLPSELKNEISCSVELTNDTLKCIVFNIQPPSTEYIAQPVKGIVQPKSKYGVKITVQPRDRDHAEKFIVQSMQLESSECLREEDITERMSSAETCKVVDEVDLMVVYEPTKPQGNCKRREDTNMPVEEVPQAKQRKIVESASGKGKLGSSKNAEATSMDINSSARGQCNWHPLQSFSRYYPTNRKYLRKDSDRAVDVTRGAMGSLLDKLGKLVTEDYNLEKSIKRDIESFSEDLRNMHRDLPKLENVDEAKIWVDEVRELSYHIENMVDSFLVHVELDSNSNGFKELRHEGLKLLVNGVLTHDQIDDMIRDIKNQVQAVADRKQKLDVNNVVAYATAEAYIDDLRNLAIYEDKEELIGIEARINELIRLFEEDGDVSEQNLKVVSIVGLGGLGKTTLAKAVYDKLQAQYGTRAFVPVGRNPDVKEVLVNIVSELEKDFNAENMDVWQLIRKLKELLQNKRYFIIIDDLWDSEASLPSGKKEAWSLIKYAFPRNKHGSRVITTTRNHDVALSCCNGESKFVYRIKPLGAKESRRLFLRRTFGSEKDCPDTLPKEEISVDILKICGGMPLAINSIASLLAGKPETTWEYVRKSLGALTEGNAALDNMKQILDLSYIHLPDHLKTCLLYVCMYPQDREIDKNDLLRQWIAEGFVHVSTNSRLDAEDVAENYFKTLIDMCMIQPGKIDYNDEVLSCRVHDIILDIMRSKSSEVNFVHVIDGSKDEIGAHGKIHRVSVHSNGQDDTSFFETMKSKDPLKHVRTVLLYRHSLVTYFLEFKYVRVLHLQVFCSSFLDLSGISRLFHLRYIKIARSGRICGELKLPPRIWELQQLETIDLQRCLMRDYPAGIVSLPRLSHLRFDAPQGMMLPDGICRMKSLHTLVGVCVLRSSVDNIKGLGELTNLRNLGINSIHRGLSIEQIDERMEALQSSISRLNTSLRILTMGTHIAFREWHNLRGWRRTLFPQGSHIRKLDLRGSNFPRCPECIGQLHDLYSFCIMVGEVADVVKIVAPLPSLAYFCLLIDSSFIRQQETEEIARFCGSGSFTALKHLRFRCKNVSLTFEEGALPKLEKLEILVRPSITHLPVGIKHLPAGTLTEISLSVTEKIHTTPDWYMFKRYNKLSLDQCRDRLIKHKKKLRLLLKGALKVHHPGAAIRIHFEEGIVDEEYDDVEGAQGVDDEWDYKEEEDMESLQLPFTSLLVPLPSHMESLQLPFTSVLAPPPSPLRLTLAPCSSPDRADPMAKFAAADDDEDAQGVDDEDAQGFDDKEDDMDEEDDKGAYQVNASQTSAQIQATTRQFVQLIEAQQDSGGMNINIDVPPMVDTSLHLTVGLEGWQRGRAQDLESSQLPLTNLLAPSPSSLHLTLAPWSSPDRAEPMVNIPVDINNDLLVQQGNNAMLANAVGQYLDLNRAP